MVLTEPVNEIIRPTYIWASKNLITKTSVVWNNGHTGSVRMK